MRWDTLMKTKMLVLIQPCDHQHWTNGQTNGEDWEQRIFKSRWHQFHWDNAVLVHWSPTLCTLKLQTGQLSRSCNQHLKLKFSNSNNSNLNVHWAGSFIANNAINRIIAYVVCSQYIFRDPCKSEVKLINREDINIRPWKLIPGATSLLVMIVI